MPIDHGRGALVGIAAVVIILFVGIGALSLLYWIFGG